MLKQFGLAISALLKNNKIHLKNIKVIVVFDRKLKKKHKLVSFNLKQNYNKTKLFFYC